MARLEYDPSDGPSFLIAALPLSVETLRRQEEPVGVPALLKDALAFAVPLFLDGAMIMGVYALHLDARPSELKLKIAEAFGGATLYVAPDSELLDSMVAGRVEHDDVLRAIAE